MGAGFTVTAGDLQFILQQIKISERHANTLTSTNLCGTLVGTGPNQIPDRLTSYGLRTVDGSCNNLFDQPALTRQVRRRRPAVPAADHPGVPRRRADHGRASRSGPRADELHAEDGGNIV